MAIPKRRKKLTSKEDLKKAIDKAADETPTSPIEDKPEIIPVAVEPKAEPKPKLKPGRKAHFGQRTEKMTFYYTKETADRFQLAFLQEQIKGHKTGTGTDKSMIVESAIKDWLDKNNY